MKSKYRNHENVVDLACSIGFVFLAESFVDQSEKENILTEHPADIPGPEHSSKERLRSAESRRKPNEPKWTRTDEAKTNLGECLTIKR